MKPAPSPPTTSKDFLSVLDLTPGELWRLLDLAAQLKAERRLGRRAPTASALDGAHVALLFEKPSLRTRSTFEVAVKEGATATRKVENQFYGDRSGQFEDPFGHRWSVATHVEDVPPDEMEKRAAEAMGAMSG